MIIICVLFLLFFFANCDRMPLQIWWTKNERSKLQPKSIKFNKRSYKLYYKQIRYLTKLNVCLTELSFVGLGWIEPNLNLWWCMTVRDNRESIREEKKRRKKKFKVQQTKLPFLLTCSKFLFSYNLMIECFSIEAFGLLLPLLFHPIIDSVSYRLAFDRSRHNAVNSNGIDIDDSRKNNQQQKMSSNRLAESNYNLD